MGKNIAKSIELNSILLFYMFNLFAIFRHDAQRLVYEK